MNYYQIQNYKKEVYPAIFIDTYIPRFVRKTLRRIIFWIMFIMFSLFLFYPPSFVQQHLYLLRSTLFLSVSLYSILFLIECMYRSYYFKKTKVDIRVLKILDTIHPKKDLTTYFLKDSLGQYVMYRLGFSKKEIEDFINEKKDIVTKKEFEIIENDDDEVSFAEFGISLMHFDSDLDMLCKKRGITRADFRETLVWISNLDQKIKNRERWWTKDSLLKFPSIGKNLSFGQVYLLEKLGHNMIYDTSYIHLGEKSRIYQDTISKLETILSRDTGGNIMLTARESYITKDVLAALTKQIRLGKVEPILEGKRLYVLETVHMISNYEETSQFEHMFQNVLRQASDAGNVILVLTDFAEFIEHAERIHVDVKSILKEALQSTRLQIISTSNEKLFHEILETDIDLMTYFEKVHLDDFDLYQTISVLEQEVIYIENKHRVFFTYQGLKRIIESADRYFAEMSLLDKGMDLLNEIVFFAQKNKQKIITRELVDMLISSKTGVALGKISKAESQKMSKIKEEMQSRIIGQKEAIETVCGAMLRARVGFAHPQRPLASFLFVGPTGVGKTETSKVLADLFFGDENAMIRSDMSEYAGSDALDRMIGNQNEVSMFASKVREMGSGILLLDEFEKASHEVHNLFLQIIDEGFFTDGKGNRVMMRNFIIIATSNAGGTLWNTQDSVSQKELIEYIISKNIFSAELLNRFDDVVIFNSLTQTNLLEVAREAIKKLITKMDSKGIILKESPELIQYIVRKSTQSQFGAREIFRIIKKDIETKIAQALILGDLFEGDTIAFTLVGNQLEIQKYT